MIDRQVELVFNPNNIEWKGFSSMTTLAKFDRMDIEFARAFAQAEEARIKLISVHRAAATVCFVGGIVLGCLCTWMVMR